MKCYIKRHEQNVQCSTVYLKKQQHYNVGQFRSITVVLTQKSQSQKKIVQQILMYIGLVYIRLVSQFSVVESCVVQPCVYQYNLLQLIVVESCVVQSSVALSCLLQLSLIQSSVALSSLLQPSVVQSYVVKLCVLCFVQKSRSSSFCSCLFTDIVVCVLSSTNKTANKYRFYSFIKKHWL